MEVAVQTEPPPQPQPPPQIEAALPSSGVDFPRELLIDILSRLPVKSLIRFTCVCKSWLSLIRNREFVDHYNATRSNLLGDAFDYLLVCDSKQLDLSIATFSFLSYESLQLEDGPFSYPIYECKPFPYLEKRGDDDGVLCQIVGPCNGIFCLKFACNAPCFPRILLWNPSMRETRALSGIHTDSRDSGLGFGFDPRTGDYKVVYTHTTQEIGFGFGNDNGAYQVELYSLNSDSWKTLDTSYFFDGSRFFYYRYTSSNGNGSMFNWMGFYANPPGCFPSAEFLITFDMSNELFMETPLPSNPKGGFLHHCALLNHQSNHACICRYGVPQSLDSLVLEFWVLGSEYGPTASWTKSRSVTLFDQSFIYSDSKIVGLWKDEELLFKKDRTLVSYDPASKRITSSGVEGYSLEGSNTHGIGYTESLVSVKRGCIESDRQEQEQRFDPSSYKDDQQPQSRYLSFGKANEQENAFLFEMTYIPCRYGNGSGHGFYVDSNDVSDDGWGEFENINDGVDNDMGH